MKKVYLIHSEWDIGHQEVVFSTKALAKLAAKILYKNSGMEEPFKDVLKDGMIQIHEIDYIDNLKAIKKWE